MAGMTRITEDESGKLMENSKIEWCDHTFNPWWGCQHAGSPGCDNCYAEAFARRLGIDCFGLGKPRRVFGETHWAEPLRWNRAAEKAGKRAIVFSGSMCDIFEPVEMWSERWRLYDLIGRTPNLFWLLLTKRPENLGKMKPPHGFPENVGLGVTVETQDQVWRIYEMLMHTASVYFVSHEPALSAIKWPDEFLKYGDTALIITGGESGENARPINPGWVLKDRDECVKSGVRFNFKQWGEWRPVLRGESLNNLKIKIISWDGSEISLDNTVDPAWGDSVVAWAGKKHAGRMLVERVWDEMPEYIRIKPCSK